MQLGYNTNGFGFHRLDDVIDILAEIGYSCIALTLDVHHADPFRTSDSEYQRIGALIKDRGMSCVIETGARFLLDPRRKHRPTLLDENVNKRREFLVRAMHVARLLDAACVSYWSGAVPVKSTASRAELMHRLGHHVRELEQEAQEMKVKMAIEPEPGFFIESMSDYDELCESVKRPLGLTLDIGHLKCVEKEPPKIFIERYADRLLNVQLDDMKAGIHEHLFFGDGEVDFPPVFESLKKIGYQGPACVELSDASRNAVATALKAFQYLHPLTGASAE